MKPDSEVKVIHSVMLAPLVFLLALSPQLGLFAQNTWNLDGNFLTPGQFLGSTNFEAVDMRAGNMRVLRIEPDPRGALAGNIIGGFISNRVEQPGSGGNVIAGG